MASNLPPGVTDGMLPGNRPEDAAWERFHEQVDQDANASNIDPETADQMWIMGVRPHRLVEEVLTYESDTFSADGSDIRHAEATQAVINILGSLFESYIDGEKLAAALADHRECRDNPVNLSATKEPCNGQSPD